MQKSLSEAKLALFDERQQVIKLVKENDALKLKEIEDRKKISELLTLANVLEEDVVLFKDVRPGLLIFFLAI